MTTYAYDSVDQILGKTDPGPLVQVYTYDLAGQRHTLKDPDNGVRTFTYDSNGQPRTVQMPSGKFTTFQYDVRGQETTVIYGDSSATVTNTYDEVGNLLLAHTTAPWSGANSVLRTYDLNGNPQTEQTIKGDLFTYVYDALDRPLQRILTGTPRSYTYDEVGNLTFTNETGWSVMDYNLAGEISSYSRGIYGPVTHVYDLNGNLTVVDGSLFETSPSTVTMTYDKENRQVSHSQGVQITTYTYSGDGLKRSENLDTGSSRLTITTLIWDGSEYLGEL